MRGHPRTPFSFFLKLAFMAIAACRYSNRSARTGLATQSRRLVERGSIAERIAKGQAAAMYHGAGDGPALGVDLVLDHHGQPRAQPSEASSGGFRAPAVIREARERRHMMSLCLSPDLFSFTMITACIAAGRDVLRRRRWPRPWC